MTAKRYNHNNTRLHDSGLGIFSLRRIAVNLKVFETLVEGPNRNFTLLDYFNTVDSSCFQGNIVVMIVQKIFAFLTSPRSVLETR